MAVRKLDKFIPEITQELFPALRESIGLNLYNDPIYSSTTINTYAGELEDTRVKLEISSNHVELVDYMDQNTVFATIYYGIRGAKVGVLNLDNINECVGLIYSTLYELGFRTPEDIEKEKKAKEEKERQEQEKKKAEAERKRQERKAKQQAEEDKEKLRRDQEKKNEVSPEEESEQSLKEAMSDFNLYLDKLKKINSQKSVIIANISFGDSGNSFKIINIDMNYIDKDNCLVETNGINPQIKKEVSWTKAKNYISKVTKAVNGVIAIDAVGPEGEEISINDSQENTDGVNLDFNL